MPVMLGDPALKRLLDMLGAPANCTSFRLIFEMDDIVRAEATYYPDINVPETVTERYVLVKTETAENCNG